MCVCARHLTGEKNARQIKIAFPSCMQHALSSPTTYHPTPNENLSGQRFFGRAPP